MMSLELIGYIFWGLVGTGIFIIIGLSYLIYKTIETRHECVLCGCETNDSVRVKQIGRLCPKCLGDAKDWGFLGEDNKVNTKEGFVEDAQKFIDTHKEK